MFETMTTNGATILTLMVLGGSLVWMVTYMYMAEKIRRKENVIEFLDVYIEETEKEYGHLIDDYIQHYYEEVDS